MMRTVVALLVIPMCLLFVAAPANSITVELNEDGFQREDQCQGGSTPGRSWLIPFMPGEYYRVLDYDNMTNDEIDRILTALGEQYPTWRCEFGVTSLHGTLYIDTYRAVDDEGNVYVDANDNWRFEEDPDGGFCLHGAKFEAHYAPTIGESALDLDWIQLYSSHGGMGYHHYEVDGTGDTSPAYYTINDNPGNLIFRDFPAQFHPEQSPWSGGAEFTLLLATFDLMYRSVTLYEGVQWGFAGECVEVIVPLPTAMCLGALGLVILGLREFRRNHGTR